MWQSTRNANQPHISHYSPGHFGSGITRGGRRVAPFRDGVACLREAAVRHAPRVEDGPDAGGPTKNGPVTRRRGGFPSRPARRQSEGGYSLKFRPTANVRPFLYMPIGAYFTSLYQ